MQQPRGEASNPEPSMLPDFGAAGRSHPYCRENSSDREHSVGRHRSRSHVGSFPLQSRVVGAGHGVPGVHVAVHAHGDTFLQSAEGIPE